MEHQTKLMGVSVALALALTLIAAAWFFQTQGSPSRSSPHGTPNAPAGVSLIFAGTETVGAAGEPGPGNCTESNIGSRASPTALENGTNIPVCLTTSSTGFSVGDILYAVELAFNRSANASTTYEVEIAIDVTPPVNNIAAVSYVRTSSSLRAAEDVTYVVDVTLTGDSQVTMFAVLATEL